ncbi:hypothetical protein [Mycolicibacterium rhodesiae]|nr:hypothetical protein [Mycolicibacterium rhodesiae]MCV7342973.1 hypothetical protein [Mycolicibacterium rhodesiae]
MSTHSCTDDELTVLAYVAITCDADGQATIPTASDISAHYPLLAAVTTAAKAERDRISASN